MISWAPESCFKGNMLGYNETNFFSNNKAKTFIDRDNYVLDILF